MNKEPEKSHDSEGLKVEFSKCNIDQPVLFKVDFQPVERPGKYINSMVEKIDKHFEGEIIKKLESGTLNE